MAAKTKLYEVPDRKNYGISERALTERANRNIDKPDSSMDAFNRAKASILDAAQDASPFRVGSPATRRGDLEQSISSRDSKYAKDIADKEAFTKALKNKKEVSDYNALSEMQYKKGGVVKKSTHSAKRRDGCAQRGKTKGRFI